MNNDCMTAISRLSKRIEESSHRQQALDIRIAKLEALLAKGKRGKFTKPSVQEVIAYCVLKGLNTNEAIDMSESFMNHFNANGWLVGTSKAPMKSWHAAVSNFIKRAKLYTPSKRQQLKNISVSSQLEDTSWAK